MSASSFKTLGLKVLQRVNSGPVLVLVATALLGLTAAAWGYSRQTVNDRARQRFEFQTEEIMSAIEDRMDSYEQVLWSGVGLFNASEDVSRQEWEAFSSALDLDIHFPGIQGLGFSILLDPAELADHEAQIRAEGFDDYEVRPVGARDEYSAIVFLEPFDERNQQAFGFDMWSNELRREAMTRARDYGVAATSGAITLVQEIDDDVQRGFLTYVPVYEQNVDLSTPERRRDAFLGWVYAPFRAGDLMNGIVGTKPVGISYEVYDSVETSPEHLLFDSDETLGLSADQQSQFSRSAPLELQGRTWTLIFYSGPEFIGDSEARQSTLVALAGLALSLLIFLLIVSSRIMQQRALLLAEDMTAQLRAAKEGLEATNSELAQSNTELEQFIYTAAHDLQAPLRTITSFAMLLDDEVSGITEDGRQYLGRIVGSTTRMSKLLIDLLTYARLGADEQPAAVDLKRLASAVVDDVLGADNVNVSIGDLPTVTGYETHLRLLLQNYVDNAVKFSKPDVPLRLKIEAERQGSKLVVSVEDNGQGFEPEFSDRAFSVFQRLPGSEGVEGTGIGLAHCRKIALMHKGRAWATSTAGVGSTFYFSIALETEPNPESTDQAASAKVKVLT